MFGLIQSFFIYNYHWPCCKRMPCRTTTGVGRRRSSLQPIRIRACGIRGKHLAFNLMIYFVERGTTPPSWRCRCMGDTRPAARSLVRAVAAARVAGGAVLLDERTNERTSVLLIPSGSTRLKRNSAQSPRGRRWSSPPLHQQRQRRPPPPTIDNNNHIDTDATMVTATAIAFAPSRVSSRTTIRFFTTGRCAWCHWLCHQPTNQPTVTGPRGESVDGGVAGMRISRDDNSLPQQPKKESSLRRPPQCSSPSTVSE